MIVIVMLTFGVKYVESVKRIKPSFGSKKHCVSAGRRARRLTFCTNQTASKLN